MYWVDLHRGSLPFCELWNFSWFLLRTLWENCFRKLPLAPSQMFMYFSTFFLEMSSFEWNSKIRVTLDICNSVTIWRNSQKFFSWHFNFFAFRNGKFYFWRMFFDKMNIQEQFNHSRMILNVANALMLIKYCRKQAGRNE